MITTGPPPKFNDGRDILGYADGRGLPGFAPYLRAKYDLPEEAIRPLEAHFQLLNDKYRAEKGVSHDERDDSAA
jgi:hypothetical protein